MTANVNPETGIAYGYISANALHPDIVQALQDGTDVYYADALEEAQKDVARTDDAQEEVWHNLELPGNTPKESPQDELFNETLAYVKDNWAGSSWEQEFNDSYSPDEPVHEGTKDGVKYRTSWLGGALNVYIFESPFVTETARECSLCVPHAGNLDQVGEGSYKCYDVPPEWRDEK